MGDDPALPAGQREEVLLASEDGVIVARRLSLVRQEPLEFKAAARTPLALALTDGDDGAAFRTAESDGREAFLLCFSLHSPPFAGPEAVFLPEGRAASTVNLPIGESEPLIATALDSGEATMEREIEYLRQQCEYLERIVETCLSHISSLEARVAELERRPVVIALPEEPVGEDSGAHRSATELLLGHGITVWENTRYRRR